MTVDVSQFTPLIAQTPAVNEGVHYDSARRIEAALGQERALVDVTRDSVRRESVTLQLSEQATRLPAPAAPNTSAAPSASPVSTNTASLVDISG